MLGHEAKDCVKCANPELIVIRDWNAMMGWSFGLNDDMAAHLVDDAIIPTLAEHLHKGAPCEVPRHLHAEARTSSRSRRKRMELGTSCGASK